MARRKKRKLNRKVVIVLAAIGVLLLAGVVAAIYRYRDKIWPLAPAASARLGDEAFAKGDLESALGKYGAAVGHSQGREKTEWLVKYSEMAWKCLEATPADQIAQKRSRYALFLKALDDAKRQSPDALEPRKRLVEHWFNVIRSQTHANRPYTQFFDDADNLLKIDPTDHLTLYRRGFVYGMRSEVDVQAFGNKAMADFRKALDLKKDSVEYWSNYIAFLQFMRSKEKVTSDTVVQAYQEASRNLPDEPSFYIGLGSFKYHVLATDERLKEKCKPEVLALYRTAMAKNPGSATGYMAVAEILLSEGAAFNRSGQKEQAAAAYEKAMAILRDARQNTDELHRISHMQAVVYERQGQFDKGIDAYREAIAELQRRAASQPASQATTRPLSPELVKAMTAELYLRLGHALLNDAIRKDEKARPALIEEARACLTSMRKLSNDPASVNLEVRLALADKKDQEAFRLLEEAYDKNSNILTFESKMLLANLCMFRNIPNKAQDVLKEMAEPAETELAVQLLLVKARCRAMLDDVAGAGTLLDEALRRDPSNENAKKMRGEMDTGKDRQEAALQWRLGQKDEAIRGMERVLQRRNTDVQVIRDLAEMYDATGRREKLMAMLADAHKRLPDDKGIQLSLAWYGEANPAKRKEAFFREIQSITDPLERNLALAAYHTRNGEVEQAVACLDQAHLAKPKDARTVWQLFSAEMGRSRYDAARKWATELATLEPMAGQAALGELAMALRDADAAIAAFTKVLDVNPHAKEILVRRGRCYLSQQKFEQAQKDFQAAWDLDNRLLEATVGLAQVAAATKDETAAAKWIKTAFELPEGIRNKWIRDMTVSASEKRHDPVQSLIQSREKILAVAPDDDDNRIRLGQLYTRANQSDKAEEQFLYVYEHSAPERIRAAESLVYLYQDTRRPEKARSILNDLQQKTEDRAGAMRVYADYLLRMEGATPGCRQMIDAAIQLDPKSPLGYIELGKFHVIAEQWEEAIGAMEKALSIGFKNAPDLSEESVRSSIVQCVIRARLFDRARKRIDEMFARDKNDLTAFLLMDQLYEALGETENAKDILARAIKVHDDTAELYWRRGSLFLRLGELQEAYADLAMARKLAPEDIAVGMTLGKAYERRRLYDKARAEYVGVMSQNPSYRPAYERLLQMYLQGQDWVKFNALIEQARQSFPDDPMLLMQEGQMWMQRKDAARGLARMKQASELPRGNEARVLGVYLAYLAGAGRHEDVLSITQQRASQADPPAWLLAARALATAKLNDPAQADALFLQALQVSTPGESAYIFQRAREAFGDAAAAQKAQAWGQNVPKNWEWQMQLGQFYCQQAYLAPKGPQRDELIQQAASQCIMARDVAPAAGTKADIEFTLGSLLQWADRPKEAEQVYLRVLALSPRHLQANNNLAVLYVDELNQPEKAIVHAETIMKYHDVDANLLDTYGWALAKAGQYEKAAGVLVKARMQDMEMPDIRFHLGWTLEQLKRIPEARTEYRRGAEIVGAHPDNKLYEPLQAGLQRTK